jgi:hypothetical protein
MQANANITLANPGCPYCGTVQDPPPQRKRKCRDCGEIIHTYTEARKRYLITAQEAERRQRRQQAALRRSFNENRRRDLLRMQRVGIRRVKVLTSRDGRVCDYCRALEGKTFKVADALLRDPLSGKRCDGELCRCTYVAVVPGVTP